MAKRKLIEMEQENLVECDNPRCDFKVKNESGDPYVNIDEYLNVPCPKCGENLLTEEDLHNYTKFIRMVKWWNKWFSWTLFLFPRKNTTEGTVHIHKNPTIKAND